MQNAFVQNLTHFENAHMDNTAQMRSCSLPCRLNMPHAHPYATAKLYSVLPRVTSAVVDSPPQHFSMLAELGDPLWEALEAVQWAVVVVQRRRDLLRGFWC
jgi:hypothetical protein